MLGEFSLEFSWNLGLILGTCHSAELGGGIREFSDTFETSRARGALSCPAPESPAPECKGAKSPSLTAYCLYKRVECFTVGELLGDFISGLEICWNILIKKYHFFAYLNSPACALADTKMESLPS